MMRFTALRIILGIMLLALLLSGASCFTKPVVKYTLTITTEGQGSVTPSSGGQYGAATSVTLTVTPDAGWIFDSWQGTDGSQVTPNAWHGSSEPGHGNVIDSYGLLMSANKSIKAVFTADPFTYVGGIISTSTHWDEAHSPYKLAQDVQIAEGVTLTVDPGVTVVGFGANAINVWGTFDAQGTKTLPITFESARVTPGNNATNASIVIKSAVFHGGNPYYGGNHGTLSLSDSFLDSIGGMYIWYPWADCTIERNTFSNAGTMSIGTDSGVQVVVRNNLFLTSVSMGSPAIENWASYDTSSTLVEKNSFLGTNVAVALKYASGQLAAINNYWGTTDIGSIEARIHDKHDDLSLSGYIAYEPILNAPDPGTPVYP